MSKISVSYELTLPHRRPGVVAYQWLYESLRSEILEGRLRPGARLPASRDLARQYGLARGTIVNAFDQLASEGYIAGTVGSGTYVNSVLPEKLLQVISGHDKPRYNDSTRDKPRLGKSRQSEMPAVQTKRQPAISDYARRAQLYRCYENRPIRAFRPNLPALDLFPTALWTSITTRRLRRISTRNLMGCDPLGYVPLRQAVAEYLSRSRGVRCVPQQIAIVSGVQEALDLAARLLLNPGDRVCVENPGYPGAVLAFRAVGAKIATAGVDDHGIVVQQLPARGVHLVYVTPAHQFPLGTTMTLARRLELLAWAGKSGAVIFEDDYDSEYRYSGRPIPALQGLDERGMVFYAGSFSKVTFPALRLGYVVVPFNLLDQSEAILSFTVRHAPLLQQLVLNDFITEGHFGRHLRRMREIYAERFSLFVEEAGSQLAGLLDISNVEAGLQTAGWLCEGLDAESAATAAARRNVDVTPLDRYMIARYKMAPDKMDRRNQHKMMAQGLQLGFAALDAKEIRRGVRELAIALEGERKAARERLAG